MTLPAGLSRPVASARRYGANLPDLAARARGDQPQARRAARPHFSIVNRTDAETTYAEVYIYDEIGYWGVAATDMVHELTGLVCDEIDVHINSPGGDVWDGIAIFNGLLRHTARINVIVDGLAASAASVIAMAGDTVTMAQGAQMMVHDASGYAAGNADTMTKMAELLDQVSDNLAAIYAARAGGGAKAWRTTMKAETWYSDDEAVAAGLADKVDKASKRGEENLASIDIAAITEAFGYRYKGRPDAPAPEASASGTQTAVPADPATDTPPPPVDNPVESVDAAPLVAAGLGAMFDGAATELLATPDPTLTVDPDLFSAAATQVFHGFARIDFTPPGVDTQPEASLTKDLGTAFMEATRT